VYLETVLLSKLILGPLLFLSSPLSPTTFCVAKVRLNRDCCWTALGGGGVGFGSTGGGLSDALDILLTPKKVGLAGGSSSKTKNLFYFERGYTSIVFREIRKGRRGGKGEGERGRGDRKNFTVDLRGKTVREFRSRIIRPSSLLCKAGFLKERELNPIVVLSVREWKPKALIRCGRYQLGHS
jgi:hypothetical protein